MPLMVALTPVLVLAQNTNDNFCYGSNCPAIPGNTGQNQGANSPIRNMMGNPDYPGWFTGEHHLFGLLGIILMILFWILIIIGIIYLIRFLVWGPADYHRYGRKNHHWREDMYRKDFEDRDHLDRDRYVSILKERYARGEINREEYRELMDELRE